MSPPSESLETSNEYLTPHTRIGLTIGNLISIAAVVAAVVIAWQKIPNSDDVKEIARESVSQAMVATKKGTTDIEERLKKVETRSVEMKSELSGLNDRMDNMLILMAGSAAEDMHNNSRSRKAAETVRRNLKEGGDPLEGLPWRD